MDVRPKTIFLDIDGTITKHTSPAESAKPNYTPIVLPGVLEKLREWDYKGYKVILTTGRKESARKQTEEQLAAAGIFYDQLLMGLGGGVRVVINDRKPDGESSAKAIVVERDTGLTDLDI